MLRDARDAVVKGVKDAAAAADAAVGQGVQLGKDAIKGINNAAQDAAKGARDAGAKFDKNVTQPLLKAAGLSDITSVFGSGKKVYKVEVEPKYFYSTNIENGTLFVFANAGQIVDWTVGVDGDQLLIDGPDFERREVVGYRKYDCWDGCNKEEIWETVTHPNLKGIPLAGINTIVMVGSEFDDKIVVLNSVTIHTQLEGRGGNDFLVGGSGPDKILGGSGKDTIIGGSGDDELYGNEDDDQIMGELGNDRVEGGTGKDILDEQTLSNADDTSVDRSSESNILLGEEDDDILRGSAGSDRLDGGSGQDRIQGNAGNDTIIGGTGDDFLYGDDGVDTISGNDGVDTIEGGAGNDIIYGTTRPRAPPVTIRSMADPATITSLEDEASIGSMAKPVQTRLTGALEMTFSSAGQMMQPMATISSTVVKAMIL